MSARMRVLTVFAVSRIFGFYDSVQLYYTNQNRENQNLPPITLDLPTRLLRKFSWPVKYKFEVELANAWASMTNEINDLFAEQGDCPGLELDSRFYILLDTGGVIEDSARIAHKEIERNSLTREVFPASDVLFDACYRQSTFGRIFFRYIQKKIGSFRKHQLSIAAGVLLVRSIITFSIAVRSVYEHEVFSYTKVSLLRSRLLLNISNHSLTTYLSLGPFKRHRLTTSRRRKIHVAHVSSIHEYFGRTFGGTSSKIEVGTKGCAHLISACNPRARY
jgi:hypothetical protein